MSAIRNSDDILKAFEGLDRIPGSKQKRREPSEASVAHRKKLLGESNGWDENPIVKSIRGVETEVFTVGALARALDKQIVTLRVWEKKGFFPSAPFRLRSKSLNGKKVSGNRVYTRELIEIAIEEFSKRNLLGAARIEWSQHQDLTEAIVRRWKVALATEES